MKKLFVTSLAVVLALGVMLLHNPAGRVVAKESKLLEFSSMAGVPRPYTGSANAIRGVPGGGLPWVVGYAEGELKANGELEINVSGLVLDPTDAIVIARGIGGTNPSPSFKAIVSCLSKDTGGNPTTVNVSSGLFPADAKGNSHIEDHLSLPGLCLAPVIFVTNPGGSWFAVSGH